MALTADQTARFNLLFKSGVPYRTALVLADRPTDTDVSALLAALPSGGPGGGTGTVTSVNGKSPVAGVVTLVKGDLALGNVDNTADTAKPVSAAVSTALALKADQTAVTTSLAAKADQAATTSALAAKADLVGGKIPSSQIPAIALVNTVPVASQAAMLALTTAQVQPGDVAVVAADPGRGSYVLGVGGATDPSVLANWQLLTSPTDLVSSVAGRTGVVVLAKADVGLANVDNTADAAKPVSAPQALADTAATNNATALSMLRASNGSDIANPATFRTNLGLGTAATANSTAFDASGAATTAQANAIAASVSLNPVQRGVWAATTAYALGDLVISPTGDIITPKVAFTSGAVYSATNWNIIVPAQNYGRELAAAESGADFTGTKDGTWYDVTGMTATIPAGVNCLVQSFAMGSMQQGTAADGTTFTMQMRVADVATSAVFFGFASQNVAFPAASGGQQWKPLQTLRRIAALASATAVKLQVNFPNAAALGTVGLFPGTLGGACPTTLVAIGR